MEPVGDTAKNIVELRESIKIFDQRLSQLRDTIKMLDQNQNDKYKEISDQIRAVSLSLSTYKTELLEVKDSVSRLEREVQKAARLQDIKVIEKYLNFIDPSRFLSKEDVIKIVDNYMSGKKWS
ncbi:hypothetical protein M1293_01010 [Candidatus Parvarchaeota archaeon]|nr:hypothetical protein [Candidatus Parvarchaeota archaeon]